MEPFNNSQAAVLVDGAKTILNIPGFAPDILEVLAIESRPLIGDRRAIWAQLGAELGPTWVPEWAGVKWPSDFRRERMDRLSGVAGGPKTETLTRRAN